MPLPLPNLDTRRWTDLVEEGRALIPRYAPRWTDHNIHDPGITLLELLAWLVEQDIYRVNRVPDRHRRKFLGLVSKQPEPPRPAEVALTFALTSGSSQHLPAGLTVATSHGLRFRTLADLQVVPLNIQAVQVFDGQSFTDQTRLWQDGLPFPLLGSNPASTTDPLTQPAVYLGFDQALPAGAKVTLYFWLGSGRSSTNERQRLLKEIQAQEENCQPLRPQTTCIPTPTYPDIWCPPEDAVTLPIPTNADTLLEHHTTRIVWDYFDGLMWRPLDPALGEITDTTRGFTLDGPIEFTLPGVMATTPVGVINQTHFYLRGRLTAGRPDSAPTLADVALNTTLAKQVSPARATFTIVTGVTPPVGQEPVIGQVQHLQMTLNNNGQITGLAVEPTGNGPELFVLDYQPATLTDTGRLTVTLMTVAYGTELPEQVVILPDAPVADGVVALWTATPTGLEPWQLRRDLDASRRMNAHAMLDSTAGRVTFGDGERGRVVPSSTAILASYNTTSGANGNIGAAAAWSLTGADDPFNQALLGGDITSLADVLVISNHHPASGGADEETLNHAAGRAAEAIWVHERLLELCPPGPCTTLDQLDQATVLALLAPERATTLVDYERLALDVPGTQVQRARAWGSLDAQFACFQAPGTVTVIIVPGLPLGRPEPTAGLLQAIFAYLNRRRIVGTRLVVVGPDYLEVTVRATVRAKVGTDLVRVQNQIRADLNTFLDPLRGGPENRGWPFGRDVYRSEILQVIDQVAGVDHVLSLELIPDQGEAQCGNLCLGPTMLTTPGAHEVQVVR